LAGPIDQLKSPKITLGALTRFACPQAPMRCARRATIPTPPLITALCAPAIAALANGDDGPLQMSLYDH
jgi:hypothetical protein